MWAMSSLFENLGVVSEGMVTIAQPIDLTDSEDAAELDLAEGEVHFEMWFITTASSTAAFPASRSPCGGEKRSALSAGQGQASRRSSSFCSRFYDTEAGVISIDGQDISQLSQVSLRSRIGMITQDNSLLHRSVRDNIAYGRPDATDAEVREAARKAEADSFIDGLRDMEGRTGYDAFVGERGVKLSGGQRQRIALARVILKNAPILVLDEATSALDSEIEASIQETLYGIMEGKTVIAIAHRLSTIARMDRIVVLDRQKIAEAGTHGELLATGGIYARFWRSQSGGFLGIDPVSREQKQLVDAGA